MKQEQSTVEVGHPVTNMLMRAAQAVEGAADQVDQVGQGAVIELENGAVITATKGAANIELYAAKGGEGVTGQATDQAPAEVDPLDKLAGLAREELPEPVAGRVVLVIEHMQRIEKKIDALYLLLVERA